MARNNIDKKGNQLLTLCPHDGGTLRKKNSRVARVLTPESMNGSLQGCLPECGFPGSNVEVYVRNGSTFRKIELPELVADIPEKVKGGKSFPHVAELNSQSAKRWQKDGSLVVEIENMVDGNEGSVTATRTVVLGFDRSDKAKVLKSTTKFAVEKP
jgi:hypothetical protein